MQVAPIPTLDDQTNQIRLMTADIVASDIIPNEHFFHRGDENATEIWSQTVVKVKRAGLWAPHLPEAEKSEALAKFIIGHRGERRPRRPPASSGISRVRGLRRKLCHFSTAARSSPVLTEPRRGHGAC